MILCTINWLVGFESNNNSMIESSTNPDFFLPKEIKQAYHEKLREFHPDKRPNSQEGKGKKITAQLTLGVTVWMQGRKV